MTEEGKAKMIANVRQQAQAQNHGGAAGSGANTEKLLSQLALSQTVDIVQLLPATAQSRWYGVNMYVDDQGVAKGASLNRRASDVCVQCGLATEVRGDAFVARVWDDQEGFERLDMRVRDLASDASWVREARERNSNRPDLQAAHARLTDVTGKPKEPAEPSLPPAERLEKASLLRAEGTAAFKAGEVAVAIEKYEGALALYTPPPKPPLNEGEAAQAQEVRLTCLQNLAMSKLKQDKPYEAISACDLALELDDGAAKAWYRRGQACMMLHQYGVARKNLTRAATLLPSSREIRDDIEKCKRQAAAKAADFSSDQAAAS
uniref:Uncharacterized protein n=1 Tax=Calcidiscus leptoporus TaxID=127549 RepID=A0A7S0ITX1_9EUKA